MSPRRHTLGGLLLAPGAGAGRDQASLVAIEDGLAPLPVDRMDFPYQLAGRRIPDRPPVLIEAVRAHAVLLAARADVPISDLALGGRSMGGRMCSMAVAEGLPARALVLLSYPLHPPGKPANLRTAHFPEIAVPCLFVSGDRDPFGSPDELLAAQEAIPAPVTNVWLEKQGHSPRNSDGAIIAAIAEFFTGLR
jgi:predicted alpha/beta-hydrolase family hydrolase